MCSSQKLILNAQFGIFLYLWLAGWRSIDRFFAEIIANKVIKVLTDAQSLRTSPVFSIEIGVNYLIWTFCVSFFVVEWTIMKLIQSNFEQMNWHNKKFIQYVYPEVPRQSQTHIFGSEEGINLFIHSIHHMKSLNGTKSTMSMSHIRLEYVIKRNDLNISTFATRWSIYSDLRFFSLIRFVIS